MHGYKQFGQSSHKILQEMLKGWTTVILKLMSFGSPQTTIEKGTHCATDTDRRLMIYKFRIMSYSLTKELCFAEFWMPSRLEVVSATRHGVNAWCAHSSHYEQPCRPLFFTRQLLTFHLIGTWHSLVIYDAKMPRPAFAWDYLTKASIGSPSWPARSAGLYQLVT